VENQNQIAFLQAHECDEVQGYFISKPVPSDQIPALLTTVISTLPVR
jgi:EAL domain-containing protein (putative c-di-GMP-specific phosphodiesterase class I)